MNSNWGYRHYKGSLENQRHIRVDTDQSRGGIVLRKRKDNSHNSESSLIHMCCYCKLNKSVTISLNNVNKRTVIFKTHLEEGLAQ